MALAFFTFACDAQVKLNLSVDDGSEVGSFLVEPVDDGEPAFGPYEPVLPGDLENDCYPVPPDRAFVLTVSACENVDSCNAEDAFASACVEIAAIGRGDQRSLDVELVRGLVCP